MITMITSKMIIKREWLQTYYQLQLVDLRLAREERFVSEEFAQDTAAAPHVNSCGLSPGIE